MFAHSAQPGVVHHDFKDRDRHGAVGPDVDSMSFLFDGCEHLHRFIGVDTYLPIAANRLKTLCVTAHVFG